ncbi:hypothetical protein [Bacillus sp. V59.32b]|uniref:hypothetical protein n=1 Tax=Bacillus sp. V59.32b TaxID=1758642 RepID=UPI00135B4FD8|nr:hypothetical protein [Bacillus sp. V59.32b]
MTCQEFQPNSGWHIKILKDAGMLEGEQNFRKELMRIEDLLACTQDDLEKVRLKQLR